MTSSSNAAAAVAACDVCQERVQPTSTSAAHSPLGCVDVTRQVRAAPVTIVVLVDDNGSRRERSTER